MAALPGTDDEPLTHPGPGRPRSAEADRAILAATIDLLAEEGYAGLSMEGVAARAGVGKTTIYRRWPCKSDLVVRAIKSVVSEGDLVLDTGRARDDLVVYMRQMVEKLRRSEVGRIMPALLVEMTHNAELANAFRQGFVEPRRAVVVAALRRAVDRGEVRPDADLDLVVDATVAVFHYRLVVTGMAIDEGMPERVADLLLEGMACPRKPAAG